MGQTDNCLSPVISVLSYKVASELNPDTVFRRENGQFLTREAFGAAVRTALVETGLATKHYVKLEQPQQQHCDSYCRERSINIIVYLSWLVNIG